MTIIEQLKLKSSINNEEYTELLSNAGFPKCASNYPVITEKAIEQFLKHEIKRRHDGELIEFGDFTSYSDGSCRQKYYIGERKHKFFGGEEILWEFHRLDWVLSKVKEFKCTPPVHVLNSIIEAKKKFDYIRIVTVEEVLDPLVVGINKNNPDQYLIDWWDDDIDVSEINLL